MNDYRVVDEELVLARYVNDEISMNALAKEFQVDIKRIKRVLLKHGATIRPPYRRPHDEQFLNLLRDNDLTYSEIGMKFGVKASCISDRARRLGFKRPRGGRRTTGNIIFTEELDKKIIDLRKNGHLTAIEIADVVGIHRYRIELRLRQLGLGRRDIRSKGPKAVRIHSPHRRNYSGTLREHILIAERNLGRPLRDLEVVHHIDVDNHNNDPLNLYVYENLSTHGKAHGGLTKIAGVLVRSGVIGFENGEYFLKSERVASTL